MEIDLTKIEHHLERCNRLQCIKCHKYGIKINPNWLPLDLPFGGPDLDDHI